MSARSRSSGSAYAVRPSAPTIVVAAHNALTIASSVASATASNSGVRAQCGNMRTSMVSPGGRPPASPRLAVEKARKMSPLLSSPKAARARDADRGPLRQAAALVR